MIEHIVLFQFQETTPEQSIEAMKKGLLNLRNIIPEIIALSFGKNFTSRSKGYTHGLVVKFNTREDLEIYQDHPTHVHVLNTLIKPIVSDVLAVDYEF